MRPQKKTKTAKKPKTKAAAKVTRKPKTMPAAKVAQKPKTKAAARVAARAKVKRSARPRARNIQRRKPATLAVVAVGDAVRIPAEGGNLIGRYDPKAALEQRGEVIEGVVCSIRQIATGKLVPKTSGDLSGYVLEVVHNQTFRLHYGSDRNTGGPRGPDDIRENPVWQRLRSALQELAASKKLVSISTGSVSDQSLRSLLDGWRVVKVKAQQVEAMA